MGLHAPHTSLSVSGLGSPTRMFRCSSVGMQMLGSVGHFDWENEQKASSVVEMNRRRSVHECSEEFERIRIRNERARRMFTTRMFKC